jgi:hypothetical protein
VQAKIDVDGIVQTVTCTGREVREELGKGKLREERLAWNCVD